MKELRPEFVTPNQSMKRTAGVMSNLNVIARIAVVSGIVGWLIAGFANKQLGMVIFLSSFMVASLAICVPALRHKADTWRQRRLPLITICFRKSS